MGPRADHPNLAIGQPTTSHSHTTSTALAQLILKRTATRHVICRPPPRSTAGLYSAPGRGCTSRLRLDDPDSIDISQARRQDTEVRQAAQVSQHINHGLPRRESWRVVARLIRV